MILYDTLCGWNSVVNYELGINFKWLIFKEGIFVNMTVRIVT